MKVLSNGTLLLVEGNDDEWFIEAFLKSEKISGVDFINCKGNSNFDPQIKTSVNLVGFDKVMRYGVIRDAETNHNASFASLCGSLEGAGLEPPTKCGELSSGTPAVGIFLMPAIGQNGMLEDLCLASVGGKAEMKCVDNFCRCTTAISKPQIPSKSRAQAFLSSMAESVPHVGLGAQRGFWDFSSSAMNELRAFLNLFR